MYFPAGETALFCYCQSDCDTPVLPGKDFGLLDRDSLQRWELSWLAAGCAMGVITQDRLNKAPT